MYIMDNEPVATKRRVPLYVIDDTAAGAAWTGSVSGLKAQLSLNGATEVPSSADLVRVAGVQHYVELTQAEVDRAAGDLIYVRLPAATGRREAWNLVEIGPDDLTVPSPSEASVSTQVMTDLAGAGGSSARTAIASSVDSAVADNFSSLATAIAAVPGATETALADNISAVPAAVESALLDNLSALATAIAAVPGATETALADNISAVPGAVESALLDNFAALATAIAAVPGATETALADNISAVPAAAAAAVRDELLSVRWGVQTQPVGGSTQILTITDQPSGTVLGVVRRYFDPAASGGRLVGQTELTPS